MWGGYRGRGMHGGHMVTVSHCMCTLWEMLRASVRLGVKYFVCLLAGF